jgi:hypothetical protein
LTEFNYLCTDEKENLAMPASNGVDADSAKGGFGS